MDALYVATATSHGGRSGRTTTPDGTLDLKIAVPRELGGEGGGTNPEQLFAAGYAACFDNALASVARRDKIPLGQTSVTALVGLARHPEEGFVLDVELRVAIPDMPRDQAESLLAAAHRRCPYSRATRGNLDVRLTLV